MPAAARPSRAPEGITLRHRSSCATRSGRPCDCRPRYQAQVYSPRDRKTLRKTFGSLTDARAWRSETHTALSRGTLRAPSRVTLEQAAEQWLRAAKAGVVRTRSGDRYKPSALRGYEQALRHKLLPMPPGARVQPLPWHCSRPSGRGLQLPAELQSPGLLAGRSKDDPQDLPDPL